MASPIHVLQPSFASGLISPEVANRSDLDKYRAALTVAKNCYIRPYGPAYKRGGMMYCFGAKYNDKSCILVPFVVSTTEGYLLEIGHGYIRVHQNGAYTGTEIATPFPESALQKLRFTQSADVMFITSGDYPVKKLTRTATGWTFTDLPIEHVYFDKSVESSIETAETIRVTPSGTSGTITLTASANLFTSGQVGNYMQLEQEVDSSTATINLWNASQGTWTSNAVVCGDTWKFTTSGSWEGTVYIQILKDGVWKELRRYQSIFNFNATESGTVLEEQTLRVYFSGNCRDERTCTLNLTVQPYTKTGEAKIIAVNSATSATATVVAGKEFGTTNSTKEYAWGVWSPEFGYPSCACFFQDRLCFAATKKQPYGLWMSRTGDYYNFGVEKAGGNVVDDSAVACGFISRRQQKIMHLMPSTDLIVLTEGNEWMVSGSEVVTPSNITPRMQTSRGCNNCEPINVGNRIIFIQARGSTVRDMGYTYESDAYVGQDLTLLASDLVRDLDIVDITYKQEPNSMLYCVRSDGTLICLSYIREQEVYAWAELETDGKVEAVCCVGEGDEDKVYACVLRNGKRYIECFCNDVYSDKAQDYAMLDCAVKINVNEAASEFTVAHLAGRTIDVLADGRAHKGITVAADGKFKLLAKANKVIAGLPYTMQMELPNVELQLADGTMQGRKKTVTNAILRLRKSLGGRIGPDFSTMDSITYDEYSTVNDVKVFTGDKVLNVPMGGYDYYGKLAIESSDPYPFMLMAVVRVVTFGG